MKCPYQLKVTHKQEQMKSYYTEPAMDITQFGECVKSECPFYYTEKYTATRQIKECCRRAESEVK